MDTSEPAVTFWQGIMEGGPWVVFLHGLMLASAGVSLITSFRHSRNRAALLCALSPFFIGAVTVWMSITELCSVLPTFCITTLPVTEVAARLRVIRRPFYFGSALMLISVATLAVYPAKLPRARNA